MEKEKIVNIEEQASEEDSNLKTNGVDSEQSYLQSFWELFEKYSPTSSENDTVSSENVRKLARQKFGRSFWMKALLTYPYVLLAFFVYSFFWDFPNYQFFVEGFTFHLDGLIRIITVSGLIGYGTNWLAITMLFRPLKKHPILGQGLIPSQKSRIAFRLAEAVSRDLINPEIIKDKISNAEIITTYRKRSLHYLQNIINNNEFRTELKELIIWYIRDRMNDDEFRQTLTEGIVKQLDTAFEDNSLEKLALKAYRFVKGREIERMIDEGLKKVPDQLDEEMYRIDDVLDQLPDTIEYHSESIESLVTQLIFTMINELDVRELIEENILKLDESRLEMLIKGTTNEQLQYIQYLGAVLGTIGGFVIWAPILTIIIFSLITIVLVSTDTFLYRLQKEKGTKENH
ncbi:MAG TPA: DUF445 family protein [Balneolales bacterium]|nr:DUF445 family protein [Balneolales bacterium]